MEKNQYRVADELYKISRMSMEAAEIVLPHVRNSELKQEIKKQERDYAQIGDSSEQLLLKNGRFPSEAGPLFRKMLKSSVKMNLMLHKAPRHISELMINGTIMGIFDITKAMNHSPDEKPESRKLAEEYLNREQKNIESLRKFL